MAHMPCTLCHGGVCVDACAHAHAAYAPWHACSRMLTHDGTQVQRWPATEQLAQAVKRVEEEAAAGKRVDLELAHVRAERVLLAVVWC